MVNWLINWVSYQKDIFSKVKKQLAIQINYNK